MPRVFIRGHRRLNADDILEYQFHRSYADNMATQQSNAPLGRLGNRPETEKKRTLILLRWSLNVRVMLKRLRFGSYSKNGNPTSTCRFFLLAPPRRGAWRGILLSVQWINMYVYITYVRVYMPFIRLCYVTSF